MVLVTHRELVMGRIQHHILGSHFNPHSANGAGITVPILSEEKKDSEG